MGHWIFASQYLTTSLILPKMFTEAAMEVELKSVEEDMENSLLKSGNDGNSSHNFIRACRGFDDIVEQ